jgi:glycosyltransferase involved in cell wall biosynthesis
MAMPLQDRPLHVAVDARLFSGKSGGIEQVAIGLVSALSGLTDGDERYTILAYPASHDWIEPHVGGPCRLLLTTAVHPPPRWKTLLKRHPRIVEAAQGVGGLPARLSVSLSRSDGTIERGGVDVIHFILQRAFFTRVPSLYHPHDLQHRHLPQFFTPRERVKRDVMLKSFCDQARRVSVTSSWVKRDLIEQYQLPTEKIDVVPLTGSLGAYANPTAADLTAATTKFAMPGEGFVFYPAQTWPHKNHLRLIEAIAMLRDRDGLMVPLICSGHQTDHIAKIRRRIEELRLDDQVKFVGFVSPLELQCLYRLCRCVCIPTLFEAASGPLNEAFMAGAPAACSNVTSLPEQAADAALVFDPYDARDIATALHRLWTEDELRRTLAARGKQRVSRFTWQRAAKHFRALYRRIANRPLSNEDREILDAPPDI